MKKLLLLAVCLCAPAFAQISPPGGGITPPAGDIGGTAASPTVTALHINPAPTLCSAGNAPRGIDASGNASGCAALAGAGVSSVTANDSSLTISPTTGAVLANLNLSNANTWAATQTWDKLGTSVGAGANFGSKIIQFNDSIWNGASATAGNWQVQDIPPAGTNAASVLTFTNTGPAGYGIVRSSGLFDAANNGAATLPSYGFSGTGAGYGIYMASSPSVIAFVQAGNQEAGVNAAGFVIPGTTKGYQFTSGGTFVGPDTIITRGAAGELDIGTTISVGSVDGSVKTGAYKTGTNCTSSAAPAVCGSAAAGSFVVAAAATTVTVNTTAVTANSQIFLQEDSSLGAKLSVTCNTTVATAPPAVTARTAATSFAIVTTTPTTNPRCFSYHIIN